MHTVLSQRVQNIKPSATMAVNMKALTLRQAGKNIINLSVGEPDFSTPESVKEAAIAAIRENFTRYTPTEGILELREAVVEILKEQYQCVYKPSEIIVSDGLKQGIYNLMQALLNPGDEVLISLPYWVSYPEMVRLAGAQPVSIVCDETSGFKLTPEQLARAITPATRLLILNSPSNPTGAVYSVEEWEALGKVLMQYPEIYIFIDEIYASIFWQGEQCPSLLQVYPEMRSRIIWGSGVSKSHAMTGWRIGYLAAEEKIVSAMKKIQSQSTGCPCAISQKAALAALRMDPEELAPRVDSYRRRHDLALMLLKKIPGVTCLPGQGAFYLFPNMKSLIKSLGLADDLAFAEFLLEKAGVALVPGTAFGAPGYLRISYAVDSETLERALHNIYEVCTK